MQKVLVPQNFNIYISSTDHVYVYFFMISVY